MDRRFFLKISSLASMSALGTGLTKPVWAAPISHSTQTSLPIPPLLDTTQENITKISVQSGKMSFLPNKVTPTYGVNGPFLGPVLKMKNGDDVKLQIHNTLTEEITIHWHGLEIPGDIDGGPHQLIQPNKTWNVTLPIRQPAATCWFHPHQHPKTSEFVMKGIAGMILIEDEKTAAFNLPSDWGNDQIPLIIQDRRFKDNGEFDYELLDIVNVANGFSGDQVLVNGAIAPNAEVNTGWVRFHLLNGSNARSYRLTTSDSRDFYIIASDSGVLEHPIKMKILDIVAGERYDIIVSTHNKKTFEFVTLPFKQMGMMMAPFDRPVSFMKITPTTKNGQGKLPCSLVVLPPVQLEKATKTRHFILGMGRQLDHQAMVLMTKQRPKMSGMKKRMEMKEGHVQKELPMDHSMMEVSGSDDIKWLTKDDLKHINTINDKYFDMKRIDFDVKKGEFEHWVISQGTDKMLHPFHIHGCRFRVVSINGAKPAPYLAGWKDTISVLPAGKTELLVQFNHLAIQDFPYMAHCHILEHEDTGMMMQFTVSD